MGEEQGNLAEPSGVCAPQPGSACALGDVLSLSVVDTKLSLPDPRVYW